MSVSYFVKIDGFNNPVLKEGKFQGAMEAHGFNTHIHGREGSKPFINGNMANEYQTLSVSVFGDRLKDPKDAKTRESSFEELKKFLKDAKQGELKVTITGQWQKPGSDKMEDLVKVTLEKCKIANLQAGNMDSEAQIATEGSFDIQYGSYQEKVAIVKPDYSSGGEAAGGFNFVENKAL